MSYEYARIPLKPSVNVICGPNGSGKSSILLGISVTLAQSHTERSRKLSDLIRWGKSQARVTLTLDNRRRSGRRPIPRFNKDEILLTRVLRKDGDYWFELDNKAVTREEVRRLLNRLGVDPENLLIIVHQGMMERFAALPPQERLRMVEAAVGLEPYRKNVLEARRKLERALSQEEATGKLLESAEQTLSYWREQYERYQRKKELQLKKKFLEREAAWVEVMKKEELIEELKRKLIEAEDKIKNVKNEIENVECQLFDFRMKLNSLKDEWRSLIKRRLKLEGEIAKWELKELLAIQGLEEINSLMPLTLERIDYCLSSIDQLPLDFAIKLFKMKEECEDLRGTLFQFFTTKIKNFESLKDESAKHIEELKLMISNAELEIERINRDVEISSDQVVDLMVDLKLLCSRKEELEERLKDLNEELSSSIVALNEVVERAEALGPRLTSTRDLNAILDEMHLTDGHLLALADVSEEVERMYESYVRLYEELKEKARVAAENREKAMEEVKERTNVWKSVIQSLLDKVNIQYQTVLNQVGAIGEVKLINGHDVELAGLEPLVGFKGAKPVPLDAYVQSGGERSVVTMAFLLALQQHVRSPLRAVDEFHVHMDDRNKELIANLLISSAKGSDVQYLLITPSSITFDVKDVHVITVQSVRGSSIVKEVA